MLFLLSGVFTSLGRFEILGDEGFEATFSGDEASDIASTDDMILSTSLPLLLPGELGGVLNAAIRFFLGC